MGGFRGRQDQAHGVVVVPQRPRVATILLDNGQERRRFIFPYSLWVMFYGSHTDKEGKVTPGHECWLNSLHVAFGKEPFEGKPDDKLYGLPLRNHNVGHTICFYAWPSGPDPETMARRVIDQYWLSSYEEYHDSFSYWNMQYEKQQSGFLGRWEKATAKGDYQWILQQNLIAAPHNVTLKQILDGTKSATKNGVLVLPDVDLDLPEQISLSEEAV